MVLGTCVDDDAGMLLVECDGKGRGGSFGEGHGCDFDVEVGWRSDW